jgi:hypothetical protein
MRITTPVLTLAFIMTFTSGAQQPKTVQRQAPAGGALSGRIFAVTNGGDIKPAIMADVYLFYEVAIHPNGTVNDIDGDDSVGLLYMKSKNNEMAAEDGKRRPDWSDHLTCVHDLMVYQNAILTTLQNVPRGKNWQVVSGQTDEDGYFKLSVPRQGSWMLVAHGQAGAFDAAWEHEGVRIFLGRSTEIKLGSPEKSCSKLDGE